MHVHRQLDRVKAEFVRSTQRLPAPNSTAGHPHREGLWVVVATLGATECRARFDHRCSPEFTSPDHQSLLQQAPLFEIPQQRSGSLIGLATLLTQSSLDVAVMIPARVVNLNETNTPFRHSAGEQALAGERTVTRLLDPVRFERRRGFAHQIDQFGRRRLHPIGHFVGLDAGADGVDGGPAETGFVQLGDQVQRFPLREPINAVRVGNVQDRVATAAKRDTLVLARQEASAPHRGASGQTAATLEHDKTG